MQPFPHVACNPAGQSRLISLVCIYPHHCMHLSVTSSRFITHSMPNSTNAIYMSAPKSRPNLKISNLYSSSTSPPL